jgi:hypothetical protein
MPLPNVNIGASFFTLFFMVPMLFGVGLVGCAAWPASVPSAEPRLALAGWHGVSPEAVAAVLGPPSAATTENGALFLRFNQSWVVGAAGERYKVADPHYPIRGKADSAGGSSPRGGFNASLTICTFTFELLPSGLVDKAWLQGRNCPVPAPPR